MSWDKYQQSLHFGFALYLTYTGFSNYDAADMVVKEKKPRLVQGLNWAYTTWYNESRILCLPLSLFLSFSFCAYIPTSCQVPVQEVSCIHVKKEYFNIVVIFIGI